MSNRDVVAWNTLIAGLFLHGLYCEMIRLVKQMQETRLNPNASTVVSILPLSVLLLSWQKKVRIYEALISKQNEYRAKVGGPAEDGTPETDDLAIWSEITGGTKKNRILGFPGYRARDLLGPPPIVPSSIAYSSPQPSIDHKVLESMIDKIVLRRLGIESIDDASIDDSMPQPSVGIDINEHITKMVEAKFTNYFLQTFTNYESIEHEVYRLNLDFLEENDDEVADHDTL